MKLNKIKDKLPQKRPYEYEYKNNDEYNNCLDDTLKVDLKLNEVKVSNIIWYYEKLKPSDVSEGYKNWVKNLAKAICTAFDKGELL